MEQWSGPDNGAARHQSRRRVVRRTVHDEIVATRLFISYDFDNDATLKDFLVGQSKNEDSPFEFADASVKAHLTGDWKEKVKGQDQSGGSGCCDLRLADGQSDGRWG